MMDFKLENATQEQITIESVDQYLKKVKEISKNCTLMYRGHANMGWTLKPSVGRLQDYDIEDEKQIFLKFKMKYHLYIDDKPATDIDTLFLAQHFGLPTRLMDWSDSPLVALWFACLKEEFDGCIYTIKAADKGILNEDDRLNFDVFPKGQNVHTIKEHLLIIPDYTNRRFLNQKGMFLWFKNPNNPIEHLKPSFIISKDHKKAILEELTSIGVDEAFVYPDLEHLCATIKNGYEFEKS